MIFAMTIIVEVEEEVLRHHHIMCLRGEVHKMVDFVEVDEEEVVVVVVMEEEEIALSTTMIKVAAGAAGEAMERVVEVVVFPAGGVVVAEERMIIQRANDGVGRSTRRRKETKKISLLPH